MASDSRPLVLHVVHRFDTGGIENGLVNLINHMPAADYRHAVLSLTEVSDFRHRVQRDDVSFTALHKTPGHGWKLYPRLWRKLRELAPSVVHTRNLGPLEMQVAAAAARVPLRIHGEHGRDLNDLDGSNKRLQRVRRLYAPFVHHYVALSCDLKNYLVDRVGIRSGRVSQIYNGVDAEQFKPATRPAVISACPWHPSQHWLVGTVGRMQGVKTQTLLAHGFVRALEMAPMLRERLRLVMVGEGPLRAECKAILTAAKVADLAWLPGERGDVADVMRGLNTFVLPSLAEGISNTILEAMASGLAVVATRVGGNVELVDNGRTGILVPSADVQAMAQAIVELALDPRRAAALGAEGRREAERRFSLQAMVMAYRDLYDQQLAAARQDPRKA